MERRPGTPEESRILVRTLACVLQKLVDVNRKLDSPGAQIITKFHASRPPGITISDYLERINKYASCSTECLVLALIYVDRLIQQSNFALSSLNIHRVIITSVMLAAKFFDDQYFNNLYYAKVGGVPCKEINSLEVEFLFLVNFSLHVTEDVYYRYLHELMNHAANSACACCAGARVPRSVMSSASAATLTGHLPESPASPSPVPPGSLAPPAPGVPPRHPPTHHLHPHHHHHHHAQHQQQQQQPQQHGGMMGGPEMGGKGQVAPASADLFTSYFSNPMAFGGDSSASSASAMASVVSAMGAMPHDSMSNPLTVTTQQQQQQPQRIVYAPPQQVPVVAPKAIAQPPLPPRSAMEPAGGMAANSFWDRAPGSLRFPLHAGDMMGRVAQSSAKGVTSSSHPSAMSASSAMHTGAGSGPLSFVSHVQHRVTAASSSYGCYGVQVLMHT